MNKILLISFSLLLFSCASPNPIGKAQQAYSLMEQDRFLMAEDYLYSALRALKEKPDLEVEADVHHALGNLYKNEGYHRHRAQFEKLGTYDGTYRKSEMHFEKAIELFRSVGSDIGVTKSLIDLGNVYAIKSEHEKQCESYKSAVSIYENGKRTGRITTEPQIFLKGYKTIGEVAMVHICSFCMEPAPATKEACLSHFNETALNNAKD